MFKVDNKDIRIVNFADFTHCSDVSTADFEYENAS